MIVTITITVKLRDRFMILGKCNESNSIMFAIQAYFDSFINEI